MSSHQQEFLLTDSKGSVQVEALDTKLVGPMNSWKGVILCFTCFENPKVVLR